jgi:hypothetical protein
MKTGTQIFLVLFLSILFCICFLQAQTTFSDGGLDFELAKGDDGTTTATATGFTGGVIANPTIPATVEYKSETYPVTAIGKTAFYNCSDLTSLTLPEGLTTIGNWAFSGCSSLISVAFPAGLTKIGDGAFAYCNSLTGELRFPDSLTEIGNYAFRNCSGLASVTFPTCLTKIGYTAFYNCSGLTGELTLPAGLSKIGYTTFYNCSGLISVTLRSATPPSLGTDAFRGTSCKFVCPAGAFDSYQSTDWASYFANGRGSEATPDGVQEVKL